MSSVLETFFFMFDSDASKVESGLEEARRKNEQLGEGLEQTDKQADALGNNMLGLAKAAGAAVAALFAFGAIRTMTLAVAASTDAMGKKAAQLGVLVGDLDAYDQAVQRAGGSAGAFGNSLDALGAKINDTVRTGAKNFTLLFEQAGLGMEELAEAASNPIMALELMAERFETLSRAESAAIGRKLGLDQGTIALLQQGRRGLDEAIARQRELGVVTEEQAEASAKFNDSMADTRQVLDSIRRTIVTAVLPAFTWMSDRFRSLLEFVQENRQFFTILFAGIAAAITVLLLPALAKATIASWALIAPWLPLALAVGAVAVLLAAIVDDIYAFGTGGDSVLGKLVERFPVLGEVIRAVGDMMAYLIEVVMAGAAFIADAIAMGPQAAFDRLRERVAAVGRDFTQRFPEMAATIELLVMPLELVMTAFGVFRDVLAAALNFVRDAIVDGPIVAIERFQQRVSAIATGVVDRMRGMAEAFQGLFARMGGDVQKLTDLWAGLLALLGRVIGVAARAADAAAGAASRVRGFLGFGGNDEDAQRAAQVQLDASTGQILLRQADASPLAATSSGAILAGASAGARSTSVQTGPITIQTQATDAEGIAAELGGALQDQLRGAVDEFDDGVES